MIGRPVYDAPTVQSYYCKCGRAATHYKRHWHETPDGMPFDSYEYICEHCLEDVQEDYAKILIESGENPPSFKETLELEGYKEL